MSKSNKARTVVVRAFFFLIGLFALFLVGCAQRLDEIDEKITDVQQRTALLEAKTGGPVGNDRELLEGQKLADVRSQISTIRNDMTVLAGKVEALEYETKRISTRQDQISQDIDQKLKQANKAHAAEPPQAEEQAGGAPGPDAEYDGGVKAHQDGDFAKAEKLFASYVSKHPKSNLSDHAVYWIGDGYLSQKMYKKAIAKFQDLIDQFPKSGKRCDARARQIQAFKALGMQKEVVVFTQVRDSECK